MLFNKIASTSSKTFLHEDLDFKPANILFIRLSMRNTYKIVILLALIGILVGLFFATKSPPALPDTQPNSALTETRSEPTIEVQPPPTPTVEDPFKKFLDQKAGSSNTVTKSDNAQGVPVKPGKDPFKEFLDKQKQNSKDQVVSPFGKN